MSVLKRFRSESKMQFYATAQKLRKDIMTLLLKDFGVRSKVRQLDIETRHMTLDDRNAFLAIAERYGITAADAEFPAWRIDFERQSLADLTRRLVLSVTAKLHLSDRLCGRGTQAQASGQRYRNMLPAVSGDRLCGKRPAC